MGRLQLWFGQKNDRSEMTPWSPSVRGLWVVASVIVFCCLGSGCVAPDSPTAVSSTLPVGTRLAEILPLQPAPTMTSPSAGESRKLTLWVTELLSPLDGSAQADVLARQIAAFEATHPGLEIELVHKKPEGRGGMMDYIVSASKVAPAVIPDLVAVDVALLPDLVHENLVTPLDGLVSPELLADLYPFAIQAGTIDEQLVALQYEVENAQHAIYNPSKIAVAPLSWTEVFSSGATYIFPAAGQQGVVNDAFLIQYLSTGAQLVDAKGAPAIDRQALVDVLSFYAQGIERGAVLTDVLAYSTVENCWPKYLQAEVVMSNISSNLYLAVRGGEPTMIPTRDGQTITLTRGYAWLLTSRDLARQPLATDLLEWLMNPANMAAWSQAAGRLPTRRAAFEQMSHDTYVAFMYEQLEHGVPYTRSPTHERIYRAMQQAINKVLIDGQLPETVAQDLLKEINQETLQ